MSFDWFVYISPSARFLIQVCHDGGPEERDVAGHIADSFGEWDAPVPFGDCEKQRRDYAQTFVVFRPFVAPVGVQKAGWLLTPGETVAPGRLIHRIVERGDSRIVLPEGMESHDFCCYCGHNNGPSGAYRNGHDCEWCGGN